MKCQVFVVPPEAAGRRLDQFLTEAIAYSRSAVQRKIKNGSIRVDDQPVDKDFRLAAGQTITVSPDPASPTATPSPGPTIVAEDDGVLVLDKPAGLVVHPADGVREPTLVDWLLATRPEVRGVGEDPQRPGIVHRLDREASGLMVVAKTQAAYDFLKRAFQEHRVEKHYTALVHGIVQQDTGVIRFPIQRSAISGRMSARPVGDEGREAETHFTVLERLPPFSLLDVETKTGRTHQIRVHLHALGHPVAGDPLYRPKKPGTRKVPPRLFLHASRLRLPHPDGGEGVYERPLADDLRVFLERHRKP